MGAVVIRQISPCHILHYFWLGLRLGDFVAFCVAKNQRGEKGRQWEATMFTNSAGRSCLCLHLICRPLSCSCPTCACLLPLLPCIVHVALRRFCSAAFTMHTRVHMEGALLDWGLQAIPFFAPSDLIDELCPCCRPGITNVFFCFLCSAPSFFS